MNQIFIKEVRAFNRFYTGILGLLDKHILDSDYSLPEARILFELYHRPGLTFSDIMALLGIDKGYLSRILRSFEKNKLVNRVISPADKRSATLQLTAKGKKAFEQLNTASNEQVKKIFAGLSEKDCKDLIQRMAEIQEILDKKKQIHE